MADISYDPDGSGTVVIRRSKTDHTGEGRELYLSPPTVARLGSQPDPTKAEVVRQALKRVARLLLPQHRRALIPARHFGPQLQPVP